ncbi:LAMI_0B06414g1_1 [Lachancea mirantina]|uniref:LAMI_0B06414g1_1 n=1 Tax=Lachancea mirantina TaxID=1230905 RepID=A0A1G4IWK8_9SACH|nr:LAMI_0B06414g1_1 [Lachancea mirantina]
MGSEGSSADGLDDNGKQITSSESNVRDRNLNNEILPETAPETDLEKPNDSDSLLVSEGPLEVRPLIQWLPQEFEYSAFDAFEHNLYLGTTTGELLHYFEMEPNNFMLVSQTKFNDDSNDRVEKIQILAGTERCLVHCGQFVRCFLLPEFAPVPNAVTFSKVNDFTVPQLKKKAAPHCTVHIYDDKSLKVVAIGHDGISVIKQYKFANVRKACVHGTTVVAAKGLNYVIFDLQTKSESPLFQISEADTQLEPLVVSFSENEFLVVCGSHKDESCMALVINDEGDISQGTIVLEKFPQNVVVQYPYVFVDCGDGLTQVYQLEINSEPKIVQTFRASGRLQCHIAKVCNKYCASNTKFTSEVTEKLRKIPLSKGNHEFAISQEQEHVQSLVKLGTSLCAYGSSGINLIFTSPRILKYNDYSSSALDEIVKDLAIFEKSTQREQVYHRLELSFLRTLQLLLVLLHCTQVDMDVIKEWGQHLATIDGRLFLYVCNVPIYGDLWTHNGLKVFICELRKLKLKHKFVDFLSSMLSLRSSVRDISSSLMKNKENILKSYDLAILKETLDRKLEIDVLSYDKSSIPQILELLNRDRRENCDLLLAFYRRSNRLRECCDLLWDCQRYLEFCDFLAEKFDDLQKSDSYKTIDLEKDIIRLLNLENAGDERQQIINSVNKLITLFDLNTKDLLSSVESGEVKVLLLESLGAFDMNDRGFLLDYYLAKLQDGMEHTHLWNFFAEVTTSYSQDLDSMKLNIGDYLNFKIERDGRCKELVSLIGKIKAISSDENVDLTQQLYDKLQDFDIGNILTFLLIDESAWQKFLGSRMLDIFLTVNDFASIESLANASNLVKILEHYIALVKIDTIAIGAVHRLLLANIALLKNDEQVIQIIRTLPSEYEFCMLSDVLVPIILKKKTMQRNQELVKEALKCQLRATDGVLKSLSLK